LTPAPKTLLVYDVFQGNRGGCDLPGV